MVSKDILRHRPNPLFASPHQLQPELNLAGSPGSSCNNCSRRRRPRGRRREYNRIRSVEIRV